MAKIPRSHVLRWLDIYLKPLDVAEINTSSRYTLFVTTVSYSDGMYPTGSVFIQTSIQIFWQLGGGKNMIGMEQLTSTNESIVVAPGEHLRNQPVTWLSLDSVAGVILSSCLLKDTPIFGHTHLTMSQVF